MSRRTTRACDLACSISNWNGSLRNAFADEVERWTRKRDKELAKLRLVVASFTPDDIAYIRRRASRLERLLADVGAPIAT